MSKPLRDVVAEQYPQIATGLLSPILELMRLARRFCDGDVDKFMIMMVVGIRTTQHRDFACSTPEELMSGALPIFPGLGTNVASIAASIDMPHETVRRKVCELIAIGWLVREKNALYFTCKAYQDLAPVREQVERLAVEVFGVVARAKAAWE